jgi:Zn-dependent M28 family amino/carboxypeptidase
MKHRAQKKRLYQDVEFLTTLRPYRNYRNLGALEEVREYISKTYGELNLEVEEQTWTAAGSEYKNIITSYNKGAKRRLVVGAHYDVWNDQPGADDNASAVAGLLETVRLVVENKPSLDYRIDFVAYCLEEPPFFGTDEMGSFIHAKSLYDQEVDVIGMVCYEMIGYFSDEPNSQPFPSPEMAQQYPSTANFIIVVGIDEYKVFAQRVHELMRETAGIDVQLISFPNAYSLAGMSDHLNYWQFGYPALMVNDTAFIRNPNYHQKSDTIDTLDFDKIPEVVNGAYNAVTGMGGVGKRGR